MPMFIQIFFLEFSMIKNNLLMIIKLKKMKKWWYKDKIDSEKSILEF